jgi:hypothetical protein
MAGLVSNGIKVVGNGAGLVKLIRELRAESGMLGSRQRNQLLSHGMSVRSLLPSVGYIDDERKRLTIKGKKLAKEKNKMSEGSVVYGIREPLAQEEIKRGKYRPKKDRNGKSKELGIVNGIDLDRLGPRLGWALYVYLNCQSETDKKFITDWLHVININNIENMEDISEMLKDLGTVMKNGSQLVEDHRWMLLVDLKRYAFAKEGDFDIEGKTEEWFSTYVRPIAAIKLEKVGQTVIAKATKEEARRLIKEGVKSAIEGRFVGSNTLSDGLETVRQWSKDPANQGGSGSFDKAMWDEMKRIEGLVGSDVITSKKSKHSVALRMTENEIVKRVLGLGKFGPIGGNVQIKREQEKLRLFVIDYFDNFLRAKYIHDQVFSKVTKGITWSAATMGTENVVDMWGRWVEFFHNQTKGVMFTSDYRKFDWQPTKEMIIDALICMKEFSMSRVTNLPVKDDLKETFNAILKSLDGDIKVTIKGSKKVVYWEKGLPSGWLWTFLLGTLLNTGFTYMVNQQINLISPGFINDFTYGNDYLFLPNWQGDDAANKISSLPLGVAIISTMIACGLDANVTKTFLTWSKHFGSKKGTNNIEYLRIVATSHWARSFMFRGLGGVISRNPISEDPDAKGLLRMNSILSNWVLEMNRARKESNFENMLNMCIEDIQQANVLRPRSSVPVIVLDDIVKEKLVENLERKWGYTILVLNDTFPKNLSKLWKMEMREDKMFNWKTLSDGRDVDGDELVTWPTGELFWETNDYTPFKDKSSMLKAHSIDLATYMNKNSKDRIFMNPGPDFIEKYLDLIVGVIRVPSEILQRNLASRKSAQEFRLATRKVGAQPTDYERLYKDQELYLKIAKDNNLPILDGFSDPRMKNLHGLIVATSGAGKSTHVKNTNVEVDYVRVATRKLVDKLLDEFPESFIKQDNFEFWDEKKIVIVYDMANFSKQTKGKHEVSFQGQVTKKMFNDNEKVGINKIMNEVYNKTENKEINNNRLLVVIPNSVSIKPYTGYRWIQDPKSEGRIETVSKILVRYSNSVLIDSKKLSKELIRQWIFTKGIWNGGNLALDARFGKVVEGWIKADVNNLAIRSVTEGTRTSSAVINLENAFGIKRAAKMWEDKGITLGDKEKQSAANSVVSFWGLKPEIKNFEVSLSKVNDVIDIEWVKDNGGTWLFEGFETTWKARASANFNYPKTMNREALGLALELGNKTDITIIKDGLSGYDWIEKVWLDPSLLGQSYTMRKWSRYLWVDWLKGNLPNIAPKMAQRGPMQISVHSDNILVQAIIKFINIMRGSKSRSSKKRRRVDQKRVFLTLCYHGQNSLIGYMYTQVQLP